MSDFTQSDLLEMDPVAAISDIDALLAQQSPAHFGAWTDSSYLVPKHIEYISDQITPIIEAGSGRIIICAPPRHGKSELINVRVPAWVLWRNPKKRIILAGHNATFATTFGRKTRDLLCENYRKLRVKINGGADAAMDEWYTDKGGGMRCAGVGVGIVGLGADIFVIDDPTPDSKAAWSANHQQELRDWYTGVADRRMEPGGTVIVSMQRWPGYDFVSWLTSMKEQGRENWHIISLPDLYDREEAALRSDPMGRNPDANNGLGEALWPERWPAEALIQKRKTSEDISFYYSQYRQRPPDKSKEGLAYSSFSVDENMGDLQFDPNLPILWACDFNVDPMCSVIGQAKRTYETVITDPTLGTGTKEQVSYHIKILDEIYLRNSSTQAACDEFIKKVEGFKLKKTPEIIVYGDASGWVRNRAALPDYKIIKARLQSKFGNTATIVVKAPKANPGQRARVTTLNNAFLDASLERRMLVDNRCKELRIDLTTGKWHRDATGKPTNDLDDSNPLRMHLTDALGYLSWCLMRMRQNTGDRGERLL